MSFKKIEWCEHCHYIVTRNVSVHNIHHKAPLCHPQLLTSSGQRVSGEFLAHLPMSSLQADSQDDISVLTKLPITLQRSCRTGEHMLRQGHVAVVIRSDRRHVTQCRRDRNTLLHCLHLLYLRWSKRFHISKVTTKFPESVLLHPVT